MEGSCFFKVESVNEKYCENSLSFVKEHAGTSGIDNVSQILHVSIGAIGGILAEESNSYYSSKFNEYKNYCSDQYALHDVDTKAAAEAYAVGGIGGFIAYSVANQVIAYRSHEEWAELYADAVEHKFSYSGFQEADKIYNPVLMDMGKANFKLATAIQLINDYELDNPSDELQLKKYQSDYSLLADHIVNDREEVVVKLYGLMAVEAEDFYLDHNAYGGEWGSLPQEFKDALLVTYFNFGKEEMQKKYDDKTDSGTLPYEPLPGTDTAGGMNHLGNIKEIASALGIKEYGDSVVPLNDFSSFTEGADGTAFRYALYNLRPVAITTLDYSGRNIDGVLDDLSAEWLTDRQKMLSLNIGGSRIEDADFIDRITIEKDSIYGNDEIKTHKKIIFGNGSPDYIDGDSLSDRLYGGNGTDILNGKEGNDYLEGGADNDILDGGTGFNTLDGGFGTGDIFNFNADFGDAKIRDADGGIIQLDSRRLSVTRMEGKAGTDGTFLFVDAAGNPIAGKEDWLASVSGSTLTLHVTNVNGEKRTITAEGFSWANEAKFGITFDDNVIQPAKPAQVSVYEVADGKFYIQRPFNADGTDSLANRSLNYNAANFLYHFGAKLDASGKQVLGPQPTDAAITYQFDGNNKADVLHGSDWLATQQQYFDKDKPETYQQLRRFESGGVTDSKTWVGDLLYGNDGDDIITGDGRLPDAADYEQTGDRDVLVGGKGSDQIYGGAGDDFIFGWQSYTTSTFGSLRGLTYDASKYADIHEALYNGAVAIEEKNESNFLDGGSGNDAIVGASYRDTIHGGTGDDLILAGAGMDTVSGGNGQDLVFADSFIVETTGHQLVRDFIAPDVRPGDIAGDSFYARAYFYRKDTDMDSLFNPDSDYNDVVDGGNGNDNVFGEIGSDRITGGGGDDLLFGDRPYSAGFFSSNTAGFQNLSSRYHGDDELDGGIGSDILIGGGGSDRLSGDVGNDVLYGDLGIGVYDFKVSGATVPGDTAAAIQSSDKGWWGDDFMLGGGGIDWIMGEGGADTLDGGEDDDILYGDWAPEQGNTVNDNGAQSGDDTLYGGSGNDQLMGNGGNDQLEGGAGDDKLFGDTYRKDSGFSGTGDDVLEGGTGDDALYGGNGNDRLVGGSGADYMNGGAGDDDYDFVSGGADVLEDSSGSSTLYLSTKPVKTVVDGSNVCIYLSADGSNRVTMNNASYSTVASVYAAGKNIGLDLTVADTLAGANNYLPGSRGNDLFAFSEHCAVDYRFSDFAGANVLQFAGGWRNNGYLDVTLYRNYLPTGYQDDFKVWNHASPTGSLYAYKGAWDAADIRLDDGSTANLHITGTTAGDNIHGRSGDDLVEGDSGDDQLYGGNGNDTLRGGAGNDVLYGEAGNDVLYADDGNDVAYGNEGDDVLYANGFDKLDGGDGNDVFFASSYGNSMQGGAGADVFNVVGCGINASVSINDNHYDIGDVIRLDVNSTQVHVDAGILRFYAADGLSNLGNLFCYYNAPAESVWSSLQNMTIQFANGETWDVNAMKSRAMIASADADFIVGDAVDNVLSGGTSNDRIYGCEGDDTLNGDAGDDYLYGGAGNDSYAYGKAQGNDTIRDRDSGWLADADRIRFDSSVVESDVRLSASGADLEIKLLSTGETLRLQDFLSATTGHARNLSLTFNSGASWDMARIDRELFRTTSGLATWGTGTSANNTISGSSAANYIYGDAGNDTLSGNGGNDWIDGGAGNDTLTGGTGADTFRLGKGAGQDVLKDAAADDRVRLDFSVAPGDMTIEVLASTSQLKIGVHDTAGAVADAITTGNALGHLVDSQGSEVMLDNSDSISLLDAVNKQLLNRTVMLSRNTAEDRYTVLSAADVLGDGFSPAETARWQLVSATPTSSSGFGKDTADFDGDGNTTEAGFFLVENLFGDGVNRVGFLPSVSAGSAAFKFTLQRDDGLTLVSNMNVTVQSGNVLSGTAGNDILDGGQSDLALQINAAAGDDLIRDGYGNDVLHGGDGNDSLSHNWVDNGNDVYYGDAGNDILDAGWGNDTLVGGSGNDLYVESNLWSGDQTLIDNSTAAAGDVDTLQIGDGSYGTQDYRALWFACDGNDLLVNQLDSSGEIRVHDWFNSARPEAQLDTIRVVQDDGAVYEAHANASFAALIQAMATFSQPGGVGAIDPSLMDEYRAAWTLVTPAAA